jgi:hypothetical protein
MGGVNRTPLNNAMPHQAYLDCVSRLVGHRAGSLPRALSLRASGCAEVLWQHSELRQGTQFAGDYG